MTRSINYEKIPATGASERPLRNSLSVLLSKKTDSKSKFVPKLELDFLDKSPNIKSVTIKDADHHSAIFNSAEARR